MKIVSVINERGGVGKSTISLNLSQAIALARKKLKIAVLDLDPNRCSFQQMFRRKAAGIADRLPPIRHIDEFQGHNAEAKLKAALAALSGFDLVILDGPAGVSPLNQLAVTQADLLIVPLMPSSMSVNGSRDFLTFIVGEQARGALKSWSIVWNRVVGRWGSSKEAVTALALLQLDVRVWDHVLREGAGYALSEQFGATVFEQNADHRSKDDFKQLAKWAIAELGV